MALVCLLVIALFTWHCEQNKPAPTQVQSEDAYTTLNKQAVFQAYDEAPSQSAALLQFNKICSIRKLQDGPVSRAG
ncbi:MAG: hypothetical protein ACE5I1_22470 [bacterium]